MSGGAVIVRVEREPQPTGTSVALVTLDDPGRRNILSPEMISSLVEVLAELDADPSVGAVVLTGAPPAFCGGAPLGSLAAASASTGEVRADEPAETATSPSAALLAIYEGFEAVERLGVPTVAAVNGAAVGAGCNLALACDVRIAARSARFDSRFVALGLHPGGAHTWSLERLVGDGAARAMVLFGEVVDGEDAARLGLAWSCVDDADLLETSLALARRAAAMPTVLARRTKATFRSLPGLGSRAHATTFEHEAQLWSLAQPELAARIVGQARARSGPRN